jgi:hypothetical protein
MIEALLRKQDSLEKKISREILTQMKTSNRCKHLADWNTKHASEIENNPVRNYLRM